MEAEEDMEKAGRGRKCEDWLRRQDALCRSKCWHKSDCFKVEVNLATLTCWRYYLISHIGVSLSMTLVGEPVWKLVSKSSHNNV